MRSAGCVINDIADRNFDGRVARTQDRPLPQGRVSLVEAFALLGVLLVLALAIVMTLNTATQVLAAAGVLISIAYPFLKRWTHWPQVVLGAAFSWGIPMAFTAVTGSVPVIAWVLFAASALWIVAYDTEYAMVDRRFDLDIGLKSSAILFADAGPGNHRRAAMPGTRSVPPRWRAGRFPPRLLRGARHSRRTFRLPPMVDPGSAKRAPASRLFATMCGSASLCSPAPSSSTGRVRWHDRPTDRRHRARSGVADDRHGGRHLRDAGAPLRLRHGRDHAAGVGALHARRRVHARFFPTRSSTTNTCGSTWRTAGCPSGNAAW